MNLETLIQKGGKGCRIKHAQILLKLDHKPENEDWTYGLFKDAYRLPIVQSQVLQSVSPWMGWRRLLTEKTGKPPSQGNR